MSLFVDGLEEYVIEALDACANAEEKADVLDALMNRLELARDDFAREARRDVSDQGLTVLPGEKSSRGLDPGGQVR